MIKKVWERAIIMYLFKPKFRGNFHTTQAFASLHISVETGPRIPVVSLERKFWFIIQ